MIFHSAKFQLPTVGEGEEERAGELNSHVDDDDFPYLLPGFPVLTLTLSLGSQDAFRHPKGPCGESAIEVVVPFSTGKCIFSMRENGLLFPLCCCSRAKVRELFGEPCHVLS